jgi:transcriptional regulator with XRE-family HTH domain
LKFTFVPPYAALIDNTIEVRYIARKPFLHDLLHEARLRKGFSVQEVSECVGVTPTAVYGWEQGRNRPREENLKALCRVLKLPIRSTLDLAAA